jgi:copper ion binding protein
MPASRPRSRGPQGGDLVVPLIQDAPSACCMDPGCRCREAGQPCTCKPSADRRGSMTPDMLQLSLPYMSVTLQVSGMCCGCCSAGIEKQLAATPGVYRARVALMSNSCSVWFEPAETSPQQLLEVLHDMGYAASIQAAPTQLSSPARGAAASPSSYSSPLPTPGSFYSIGSPLPTPPPAFSSAFAPAAGGAQAATAAGQPAAAAAAGGTATVRLLVEGMTCASCVSAVEAGARQLPGVKEVAVNLMTGQVRQYSRPLQWISVLQCHSTAVA